MKFNKCTKYKQRLITLIISIVLTICMMMPILTEPLIVRATHYIGGEGSGSGYGVGDIGASSSNTAFYMYIVLGDGSACTPGILIYNSNGGIAKNYGKIKDSNFLTKQPDNFLLTPLKINENLSMRMVDSNAPYPVLSNNKQWKPNGDAVRKYLMHELQPNPMGFKYQFEYILWSTLDKSYPEAYQKVLDGMASGKYSIVVQPVAMLHCKTSYERLATLDGWVQWVGDGYAHTFIGNGLYNCMVLDEPRFGISVPSDTGSVHVTDYNRLKKTGWGLHIIEMGLSTDQSTCDESRNGEPSKPADESTGKYKIVKSYRTKNIDTGVYTDRGTFVKDSSSGDITIEDESEYKLINWKTSTTYKPVIIKQFKKESLGIRGHLSAIIRGSKNQ